MTDRDLQRFEELALRWRARTCHTGGCLDDCGDHDCLAFRDAAYELLAAVDLAKTRSLKNPITRDELREELTKAGRSFDGRVTNGSLAAQMRVLETRPV